MENGTGIADVMLILGDPRKRGPTPKPASVHSKILGDPCTEGPDTLMIPDSQSLDRSKAYSVAASNPI